MKVYSKIYFLFILSIPIFLTYSCSDKTEECPNGAILGRYFPAYSGSYWNYNNDEGSITNWTIGNDYTNFNSNCSSHFINGDCYISDNTAAFNIKATGYVAIDYIPIYYETIGQKGKSAISFVDFDNSQALSGSITRYRETVGNANVIIDSLNSFGNTLVVKEYDTLIPNKFYLDYFAKDIGLVLREYISPDTTGSLDTTRKLWLKEYHINKI
jgi:hypothetical protein